MTRYTCHDHREFASWAEPLGWTWSYTGSGHFRWQHPLVPRPVFTPSTPRAGWNKSRQKLRTALARAMAARPVAIPVRIPA